MKQRFLSICTALCLCLTLLPGAAWAAEGGAGLPERPTAQTLNGDTGSSSTATDDTDEENSGQDEDGGGTDEEPPVEDGTADAPYQIGTAEELAAFRDKVNGSDGGNAYLTACAVLTADIDLENQAWTPIGSESNQYTGTFDGGGHTISGLYINSEETYAGLFGVVGEGGTVKELTVDGSVANKGKFTGGVVIDTPGMREMGAESADLSQTFGEIEDLAQHCGFRDCTHTNEPGCAVLAAVEQGRLDQRRLDSYRKLEHESSYDGLSSKEVEVKKAERMFGKVGGIKQARRFAKEHNQRKHGKFPGGEM